MEKRKKILFWLQHFTNIVLYYFIFQGKIQPNLFHR